MPTPQRQPVPGVIARLAAAPCRFQFAQAVRVLLIWLRRAGVPPDRALREVLRFQNSLSLSFAPSQLESLLIDLDREATDDTTPPAEAVAKIRMTPAFIGLLGAQGVLPLHYTERIAAYEHASKDESLRACFDLFSDQAVNLFFRAWAKYRIEHTLDVHGEDAFRPLLLALGPHHGGLPHSTTEHLAPPPDVMAFYIGLLRQRPMSTAALACILRDHFGVPIAVEQFVGGWDDIADDRQCRMGRENATLGYSGALGVRVWRHDLGVLLRIGPLDKADYERFLPRAAGASALAAMLSSVGIPELRYVVHLLLKPGDVPPLDLVGGSRPGIRIGWDACLGASHGPRSADVRYLLRPS